MTAPRGVSQDELLAWIESAGPPEVLEDIGRRLAQDPELEAWARGARSDRAGIRQASLLERGEAPSGLWREALAGSERRALLGELGEDVEARGPYRLRVTPVRLVAAAGFLIVVSLGSIAPFLVGPSGPNRGAPSPGGPVAAAEDGIERELRSRALAPGESSGQDENLRRRVSPPALAEAEPHGPELAGSRRASEALAFGIGANRESLADSASADRADGGVAVLASDVSAWAGDANGIVANRGLVGFRNLSAMERRERPAPGAFPASWGMSASEAGRAEGLLVEVRTDDPERYVERLLRAAGRRGTLVERGVSLDGNGVSSPMVVRLSVPREKIERAVRLSAVDADRVRVSPLVHGGEPGRWASERLWWSASDGRTATVLVRVSR